MADNKTKIIISAVDQTKAAFDSIERNFQSLKSAAGGLDSIAGKLPVLGGAIAAAFGTASITAFIGSSIEAMAALKDMSEQTGASVESLSAMKGAAKLAGVEMDQVAGMVGKLSQALGEARLKGGEKAKLFQTLGIDPASVNDSGQALADLAQKLVDMPDKVKAIAIARDLLGKQVSMPFLNELAEAGPLVAKVTKAQADMADEFEKNIIRLKTSSKGWETELTAALLPTLNAFSQSLLDSINGTSGLREETRKLAKDGTIQEWAETAVQGITYVMDAADGVKRVFAQLGSSLAVVFNDLQTASKLGSPYMIAKGMSEEGLGYIKNVLQQRNNFVAAANEDMEKRFMAPLLGERFRALMQKNLAAASSKAPSKSTGRGIADNALATGGAEKRSDFDKMQQTLRERLSMQEAELASQEKVNDATKDYAKFLSDINNGYLKVSNEEMAQLAVYWDKVLKNADAVEAKKKGLEQAAGLRAADERIANLKEGFGRRNEERTDGFSILSESQRRLKGWARQDTEDANKEIERLTKQLSDGKLSAEAYAQKVDEVKTALAAQGEAAKTTNSIQDSLNASFQYGASMALQSYLDEVQNVAATSAGMMKNAFKGMEDALVNFVKTGKLDFKSLADSIISDMIRLQVQQGIMKPLAEMTQGSGGLLGGLGNLFSGIFGGARAGGGAVDAGKFYLVGEKGPELLMAGSNGTVVPNSALQGSSGGMSVVIQQTINVDSRADRASIVAAMVQAKEAAKAEIMDSMRRGGAFARA